MIRRLKAAGLVVFFIWILMLLVFPSMGIIHPPGVEWERVFNRRSEYLSQWFDYQDYGYSVDKTSDGGYIIAGLSGSDPWLIKTDSIGIEQWNKTYANAEGHGYDYVCTQQTTDEGYIIATTYAYANIAGNYDFWLIKTDHSGNHEWNRTYGGALAERLYSIRQTNDSGYIIAGATKSFATFGDDFWLVKTDEMGNHIWNKTFGRMYHNEVAYAAAETNDAGYILAGTTIVGIGVSNFWLVKTDSSGNHVWNKTLGQSGFGTEVAYAIEQTDDNGYIFVGSCPSPFGSLAEHHSCLIKTDQYGDQLWKRTLGNISSGTVNTLRALYETPDGGYTAAGYIGIFPNYDFWVIRLDSGGILRWEKIFGVSKNELVQAIQQTSDGGYIIAGYTNSYGDTYDFSLVKLEAIDDTPPIIGQPIQVPSGEVLEDHPVMVAIGVTDEESGIQNVTLSYTLDNGSTWTNVSMVYNSTLDLYESMIPGQIKSTLVKYRVIAFDNADNMSIKDNLGECFSYHVIPENPFMLLILFVIMSFVLLISYKRGHWHE
ncbi:MAG: hypothetical protein JSV05_08675 [Candidatus Bathyarchaeota archaeon]|nr:MAG: hypothetical protein JSV05_08675 [Candidatus Bathyarchaeota archaeon]